MKTAPQAIAPQTDWFAGAAVVAAVYAFFLLFAQFAFLAHARERLPDAGALRIVMTVQGLAGILGGMLAALFHQPRHLRRHLCIGFAACAAAAFSAPKLWQPVPLALVSGLTGLGVGFTTVALASGIRFLVDPRRLGFAIGAGTGFAYALANLPVLFNATPAVQSLVSAIIATAAALAVAAAPVRAVEEPPAGPDYSGGGLALWLAAFLALVWLDSGVFAIIQQTPELKGAVWSGTGRLIAGAFVHLFAAMFAGILLDAGHLPRVNAGAVLMLAAASGLIAASLAAPWVGLVYSTGVSFYSVVLVYYPARSGRPWLAALVFGLCGWIGTALGIGFAQERAAVPGVFVVLMTAIVLAALGLRARRD